MSKFQSQFAAYHAAPIGTYGADETSIPVTPDNAQAAVNSLAPPPSGSGGYDEYISYFNKSASGLKTLLFGKDARTTAAILQARLVNLKGDRGRYNKIPVVGKIVGNFLDNQIRSAQAEYNAAATQAQEEQYTANTKLVIGTLTVGLGVLGSVALLQYIAFMRARTRAIS
jgi:hypothetical protein